MVQGIQTSQQSQSESIGKSDSNAVTDNKLAAAVQPLVSSDSPLSPDEAIAQIDSVLALNESSSPPFLSEKQVASLKESKELLENDSFVAQLAGFEKMFSTLADIKLIKNADKDSELKDLKSELDSKAESYSSLKDRAIDLFSTDVLADASKMPPDEQKAFLNDHAVAVTELYNDLEASGLSLEGTAIETFVNAFESGSLSETADLSNALSSLQIDGSAEIEAAMAELEIEGLDDELMNKSTDQAQLHKQVVNQYSNNPEALGSAVTQSNELLAQGDLVGLTESEVEDMKSQVDESLQARYEQLDLPSNPALWTDSQRFLAENDPTIVYLTMTNLCLDDLLKAAKSGGFVSKAEAFEVLQTYAVSAATTLGNITATMQFYVGDQHPAYINVQEQYNAQLAQLDSLKGLSAKALQYI